MSAPAVIRHAGLLARRCDGAWRGALIEGPSGAGKSDLMLRALDAGWSLVADDRVLLWISGGRLFGRAPPVLKDLMEIRGLGIAPIPALPLAEVAVLARCVDAAQVERLPEPETETVLDRQIPLIRLTALEASGPAKLLHALTRLGLTAQPSYQARGAGGD